MTMGIAEAIRRLLDWLRQGLDEPDDGVGLFGGNDLPDAHSDAVEWPWRYRWDHLPKRSAGFGFTGRDYDAARARAEEIARLTLGDELWTRVQRVGYVDLPSRRFPGVTCASAAASRFAVRPGCLPHGDSRFSASTRPTPYPRPSSSPTSTSTPATTRTS